MPIQLPGLCTALALALQAVSGFSFGAQREEHVLPGWRGEQAIVGDAVVYGKEEWRGEIVQLSWQPRAYQLKGFLSAEECAHLIKVAKPNMRKSNVADSKTGKSIASEVRTSTGTFLDRRRDDVVARIERRVAQVTMIPEENQEGLQILHYQDGQKYEPHHDYFHDQMNQAASRGGQRVATVLMYLTTPEEGGETVLPKADRNVTGPEWSECAKRGLAVKAIKGDALMFFSLHPDGTEDPSSLHGSCPTTKGEKWSATKWIHVSASGTTKSQQEAGWAGSNTTTTQKLASNLGLCTDVDAECSSWAENGECDNNPEYMALKCPKSCKKC